MKELFKPLPKDKRKKILLLSDDIRINIEKNSPIKLTYDLGDGGIIYNYIAPKIQ